MRTRKISGPFYEPNTIYLTSSRYLLFFSCLLSVFFLTKLFTSLFLFHLFVSCLSFVFPSLGVKLRSHFENHRHFLSKNHCLLETKLLTDPDHKIIASHLGPEARNASVRLVKNLPGKDAHPHILQTVSMYSRAFTRSNSLPFLVHALRFECRRALTLQTPQLFLTYTTFVKSILSLTKIALACIT